MVIGLPREVEELEGKRESLTSITGLSMNHNSQSHEAKTWAGDLLVVLGGDQPPRSQRTQGTWLTEECDGWELHTQAPTTGWAGFPLAEASSPDCRAWLLGELHGPPSSTETLVEVLQGLKSPAMLNGHFLLIGYDTRRREWSFVTDRFGTVHAYCGSRGRRAAIGTFFPAVAAAVSRKQLDWIGLSGFFGMGFFPDDRTFYEDVRILRPASRYVFDEGGALVVQERYWSWPRQSRYFASPGEALEVFGETFLEVMREMLDTGRIAIPISGGLDSRSTVVPVGPELAEDPRIWSFSYGYGDRSAETVIGSRVARARGLSHGNYEIGPYLFERLATIVNSVECFQDITQCRQAAVMKELARQADWLIAAHWGDVWLDSTGASLGEPTDGELVQLAMKKMWKRGGRWLIERLCEPKLGPKGPREQVRQMLTAQLDGIPEDHEPDFRLRALKTETWGFRWTLASLRMYQAAVFPRLPFFDTRVTDIVSAVPSSMLEGRRLQIDFLKRYAPDLARIKWQSYDANLYAYHRFDSWHLPRRIVKKAMRTLRRERPIERNWEVQLLGDRGEQGLQHWLLRKGLRLHDLLPRREIEILVEEFSAPDRDPALGYTVSMLLTFSAWLELHG